MSDSEFIFAHDLERCEHNRGSGLDIVFFYFYLLPACICSSIKDTFRLCTNPNFLYFIFFAYLSFFYFLFLIIIHKEWQAVCLSLNLFKVNKKNINNLNSLLELRIFWYIFGFIGYLLKTIIHLLCSLNFMIRFCCIR